MADKKVALELTIALSDSNKSLEELNELLKKAKEEIKNTSKGSEEFKKLDAQIKKTEESMKKTSQATKSIGQDLSGVDAVTGGLGSKFNRLRGTLSTVVKSFKNLKFAIAATGIGALLIAVVAVGKAFTSSEEGQNKFAKILGVIGAITGNLVDLLADLGEKIIYAFENPKKSINDFANLIKENIVNRFEGLVELMPKLGEAITLLFKGQFSEAGKVATDAVGKVVLGVEGVTDKVTSATKAVKEFIAEQVKEGKEAARVADMRAKADKIERNLLIERSKLESDIAKLRLKARQENEFSAAERKEALLEAQKLEDELLDKETEALKLRRDAQILENTFSRTDKENLDKEARARAAVNNQIARRANVARQLQRELNTVDAQAAAEQTKRDNEEKAKAKAKADALEAIRLGEIVSIEDKRAEELRKEKEKYDKLIELAKEYGKDTEALESARRLRLQEIQEKADKEDAAKLLKEQESLIKSLEFKQEKEENDFNLRRQEVDRREKLLLADKTLTEQQRSELEKQFAAERVKITQDEEALRAEVFQKRLQMASDILGAINGLAQSFAKKDEESQRKAFNLNKAFAAGQVILSTAQGVIGQLAVPQDQLTGANFVKAAIVAASGAAQFTTIQRTQFGGSSSSPTAPTNTTFGGGDVGTQPRGFTPNIVQPDLPTTKVIVTETDIRKATTDISGIYNKAIVVE